METAPIPPDATHIEHLGPAGDPFGAMAAGTALFIIALGALVLIYVVLRERRRHKLISLLVEHGQPIPPTLLPRVASPHAEMRRAVWLAALALGVALTLYVLTSQLRHMAWGLIPLCLGIASFINATLLYPRDASQP